MPEKSGGTFLKTGLFAAQYAPQGDSDTISLRPAVFRNDKHTVPSQNQYFVAPSEAKDPIHAIRFVVLSKAKDLFCLVCPVVPSEARDLVLKATPDPSGKTRPQDDKNTKKLPGFEISRSLRDNFRTSP